MRRRSVAALCALGLLCGLGSIGCGRKGPPLAPIVYVPRAPTEVKAKLVDGAVVVQFTVPAANTDSSSPADLDRVEVYAHTGPLPAPADFLKYGTLVRRLEVKRQSAESGAEPGVEGTPGNTTDARETDDSVGQGWATSVRETLTEKLNEMGPMPPTRTVPPITAGPIETLETPGTVNFPLPVSRYYTVVGVSRSRNRRGPYAGPIRVPLMPPLAAPEYAEATYTALAIVLSWPGQPEDIAPPGTGDATAASAVNAAPAPSPGVATVEHVDQETPGTREIYADVETPGTQDAPWPGAVPTPRPAPPPIPRFGYNVYAASPDGSPSTGGGAPDLPIGENRPGAPVAPLNAALLLAPPFSDPRLQFGIERCYVVRRVEMVGAIAIESAPSPPVCVTPVDTFPPAPPKTLVSVASDAAVSLIWEPNTESDLGGYVVLRGEAPGDTLAPLTPAPITDAAYVDTSIERNRTYVYEVVAIDEVGNPSEPSNRIEETIR